VLHHYIYIYIYIYIYVLVAKYAFYHKSYLFIIWIGNILFLFRYPSICAEDLKLTDFLARLRNQICIMNVNSICNVNTLTSHNDFQFHLLWHMQIILHMSHLLFCRKIWESLPTLLISCDNNIMHNGCLWSSISINKVSSWIFAHPPLHNVYTTTCHALA
jgi:hypothetical protein